MVPEKKLKIDFEDGGQLGFWISAVLTIFDLQVAPILPISFESVGLSVQETKRKEDFQDGGHDGRLGFPTETNLTISSTSCIETSYQVSSQLAFQFRRRSAKTIFTKAAITYFLEFPLEQLKLLLIYKLS